jgi:serine/threonine-protein kinase
MKSAAAKSCSSCGERYDADVLFCPRDGTPLASTRSPSFTSADRDPYCGLELAGQIRIKHLIGIGSMGRVYRAFQGGIERDVAVKILHRELRSNGELVTRFHREAKVASRLVHPNVVQVLMTGELATSTTPGVGGELYLVMEHLDGISLLSALAAAGTEDVPAALPLPRALHIILQICDAVGEAHLQSIVHRDLKPENVMLVRRGDDLDYVKVLDFGIARLDWADRSMATQAGLIFGTAKYISPEGAEGQQVGPQADVYSIATMLYQMLAGRAPFEGESPVALLVQHTHTPPTELRTIARASYVPPQIAAVIMQNLAKKPADRAQNARLLGRDLVAAARAGGLYPEEIASQSTLFSPAGIGAVKLASRERTRSHELSADLAAKIGGVAAAPREAASPTTVPAAPLVGGSETTMPCDPPIESPMTVSPTLSPIPSIKASVSANDGTTAPPSASTSSRGRATAPPTTDELDFPNEAEASQGTYRGSTIQGTETSFQRPPPHPRRARVVRFAAILACALAVVPIAVFGGRKLGASSASDSVDATLDEAREAMRHHAWDAPPGRNFKEIIEAGLVRFPDDARLQDLRRDAAERLVSDALGRKYAGDTAEALHFVRLALAWNPGLTTAQHLAAELEGPRAPDVAPTLSVAVSTADRGSKGGKKGAPRVPDPHGAPPPPTPVSTASAAPNGAQLPPSPTPPAPIPPPSSTGPWL